MDIPIRCKFCSEIIFMEEELKGLEEELGFNVCDDCESDQDDD